jgi:hypothetical protein
MVSVPTGSRLVLRIPDGRSVEALALSTASLTSTCVLPVLPAPDALEVERGIAEIPTGQGLVRLAARLDSGAGLLTLEVPSMVQPVQRRAHARADIDLPVSGTAAAGPLPGGVTGWAHGGFGSAPPRIPFSGRTLDLSAGGMRARVALEGPDLALATALQELYVELDLAGPKPAAVILRVVSLRSDVLRARFVFVAPSDQRDLDAYLRRPAPAKPEERP